MFYVLFLLAPPRVPTRLRSQIVRRIHGAVKKFVLIMVALSAVRAAMPRSQGPNGRDVSKSSKRRHATMTVS